MPLLSSATGRAYLAFCAPAEHDSLLDGLARSTQEENTLARPPRTEIDRELEQIKQQGFAMTTRTRRSTEEASIAVPVLLRDRVLAVLTVRFTATAVPTKTGIERFLPKLRHCAAKMADLLSEHISVGVASIP